MRSQIGKRSAAFCSSNRFNSSPSYFSDLIKLSTVFRLSSRLPYSLSISTTSCISLPISCVNTSSETDCGSRESRLRLVQNRLSMQQTNFGELVSENEDADYTDLVIQLKSIGMTYEAALSSISYVMQTSLLDFVR